MRTLQRREPRRSTALTTSGGTAIAFRAACGAGSGDLNLNTTSLVSGGPVAVSSLTITSGN
jgi:hypothetical protein